jgi:hypothetical protein
MRRERFVFEFEAEIEGYDFVYKRVVAVTLEAWRCSKRGDIVRSRAGS